MSGSMAKRWHILGHKKPSEITLDKWVRGTMSGRQIVQLLARLHCRDLDDQDIIAETLASRGPRQTDFMVIPLNAGRRGYMTTGNPEWYSASSEEPNAHRT
jgi:hypothetical protein